MSLLQMQYLTSRRCPSLRSAGQRWESYFLVASISADSRLYLQASKDAGNANNGASDASEANLQTFIDSFVCQSNQKGTPYFFFEFFDEQWKDETFGGVEGHWGLFYQKCVSHAPLQAER